MTNNTHTMKCIPGIPDQIRSARMCTEKAEPGADDDKQLQGAADGPIHPS